MAEEHQRVPAGGDFPEHTPYLTRLRKSSWSLERLVCIDVLIIESAAAFPFQPLLILRNKHAYWRAFFSTLSVLIEYIQGWTHVPLLPFDGALGANTFFSSALAAESTAVGDALLLAGVSYT